MVALSIKGFDLFKAKGVLLGSSDSIRRLYSPFDKVHEALTLLVSSARHSLVIAMFGYADDSLAALVARALVDPLIYVSLTLDKSQASSASEKAILAKYKNEMTGNSVAIGTSEKSAFMHRKMVIVDGLFLATGSTNWSTSAQTLQDNELTISYDPVACAEAAAILAIEHDHALAQMAKIHAV